MAALANPAAESFAKQRASSFVLVVAIGALLAAQAPLVLAWCCGPADQAGLGTFWFVNDFSQYESAMDQGARGAGWLVYDRFTPEPHRPALMFTLYVALGKLAAGTGLPVEPLYRAVELAARAGLVAGLAGFLGWLLRSKRTALLAFIFSLFGMGFGLFAAMANGVVGKPLLSTGNGSYETNTFGLLFSPPHVPLAMLLTLALVMLYVSAMQRPRPLALAALCGAAAGIALLHPFHLPVLLLALGLDALSRPRSGAKVARALLVLGATASLAGPLLLYVAYTFNLDPLWGATYGAQNLLASPRPWEMPIEYGVVLLLALPGAFAAIRSPDPRLRVVLTWIGCMLVLQYLPVPYQRRFAFGLQPALAALAALGVAWLEQWFSRRRRERLGRAVRPTAVALALATTAAVLVAIPASALTGRPMPVYRVSADDAAAAAWLAGAARQDDVVVATWDTSNYLAGRVSGRVVGGHPVASLDAANRRPELESFFQGGLDGRERFMNRYGVTYVFAGARELALGDVSHDPWLDSVYQRRATHVYAVRRG